MIMAPKIKISNINYSQLKIFNDYLSLCKTIIKKKHTNIQLCNICTIFAIHIRLSQKIMWISNSKKIMPFSLSHAEAYAVLSFWDIVGPIHPDPYFNSISINIASQIQKQLA